MRVLTNPCRTRCSEAHISPTIYPRRGTSELRPHSDKCGENGCPDAEIDQPPPNQGAKTHILSSLQPEPRRVFRRPFGLSYAAMSSCEQARSTLTLRVGNGESNDDVMAIGPRTDPGNLCLACAVSAPVWTTFRALRTTYRSIRGRIDDRIPTYRLQNVGMVLARPAPSIDAQV